MAYGLERLTNARYVDDVLLYAKSLAELEGMTEALNEELAAVGIPTRPRFFTLPAKMIVVTSTTSRLTTTSSEFFILGKFIGILIVI